MCVCKLVSTKSKNVPLKRFFITFATCRVEHLRDVFKKFETSEKHSISLTGVKKTCSDYVNNSELGFIGNDDDNKDSLSTHAHN